jgi:hypothetical protein
MIIPPLEPRWKRRNQAKDFKKYHRRRRKVSPGSIKSHHLHRRYPISLRGLGHFIRNPPKVDQQNLVLNFHRIVGQLQNLVTQVGLLRQPNACDIARDATHPRHTTLGRKKRGAKQGNPSHYRPVPGNKKG